VDDDPVEVEVFRRVFGDEFEVVASTGLDAVLERLREVGNRPRLFVLDLYFPRDRESTQAERARMIKLKEDVEQAQRRLSEYMSSIGQDRSGGVGLLEQVRKKCPGVPVVFYTRKGTLEDAIYCRGRGADNVLIKPAPESFDETGDVRAQLEESAVAHKVELAREFNRLASTSGARKIRRIVRFVWGNWGKF
jgi:CheY-like chemotaxis protein